MNPPIIVSNQAENAYPSVTILIAAKNEATRISHLLDALVHQDYPRFEVLVVDDFSTDETANIASAYQDRLPMRVMQATKDIPGKKQAISDGVAAATSALILQTDADCIPATDHWVSYMVRALGEKDLCIGYGPMNVEVGIASWLSRMETYWIAMLYFARAVAGKPYMAVGRNLLFRKRTFIQINGHTSHMHVPSGDDDLLLQELAESDNVSISLHPASWVYSDPPLTLSQLISQKARHLSTATTYNKNHQYFLSIFSGLHLLVCGISAVLIWHYPIIILSTLLLKWSLQVLFQWQWKAVLANQNYAVMFPLVEGLLAIYYLLLSPYIWLRKNNW